MAALRRQRQTHLAEASVGGHCDQTDASCSSSSYDQTRTVHGTWIIKTEAIRKITHTFQNQTVVNCLIKGHTHTEGNGCNLHIVTQS
jgi:hypothetical protein